MVDGAHQSGALSACAGEAFHHEPSAAVRNMGDDRRPAVNFRDDSEIDGECELDRGSFLQAKILGFDEDAINAQIARSTQLAAPSSRDRHVNGRARTMTCV